MKKLETMIFLYRLVSLKQLSKLLLAGFFVFPPNSVAKPVSINPETSNPSRMERECFSEHLEKAMELNKIRRQKYSALTDGGTRSISDQLILSEWFIKSFVSPFYEKAAEKYWEKGIYILCDEFEPMSNTPEFKEFTENPPALEQFEKLNGWRISRELKSSLKTEGFSGLHQKTNEWLEELRKTPRFHCMLRHMLESISRIAYLAPKHIEAVEVINQFQLLPGQDQKDHRNPPLNSPKRISEKLARAHIGVLGFITRLDEKAAKFQAQGVNIICQDVPPIHDESNM